MTLLTGFEWAPGDSQVLGGQEPGQLLGLAGKPEVASDIFVYRLFHFSNGIP